MGWEVLGRAEQKINGDLLLRLAWEQQRSQLLLAVRSSVDSLGPDFSDEMPQCVLVISLGQGHGQQM